MTTDDLLAAAIAAHEAGDISKARRYWSARRDLLLACALARRAADGHRATAEHGAVAGGVARAGRAGGGQTGHLERTAAVGEPDAGVRRHREGEAMTNQPPSPDDHADLYRRLAEVHAEWLAAMEAQRRALGDISSWSRITPEPRGAVLSLDKLLKEKP